MHSLRKLTASLSHGILLAALTTAVQATGATVSIDDASDATSFRKAGASGTEVHVISIHETARSIGFRQREPSPANVYLRYDGAEKMKPISLVLSSYNEADWRLHLDPGVELESVLVNGYHAQTVSFDGPGSFEVSVHSYDQGRTQFADTGGAWPHATGGSNTQSLIASVEERFGVAIASYTASYHGNEVTVLGESINAPAPTERLGAGNLTDTESPDLLYDPRTGRVQIDLSDLAARYPRGSGEIWWQHFDAERLFLTLANHDSDFVSEGVLTAVEEQLGRVFDEPVANANRIGLNGVGLRQWDGGRLDLGEVFPEGMHDLASLREYLAAAHFSTDHFSGQLDLRIASLPEPTAWLSLISGVAAVAVGQRR